MTEENKSNSKLIKLVFTVVGVVAITLFAMANNQSVEINFIFSKSNAPLTAIMITSFLLGLVMGLVFLIVSNLKNKKVIKANEKEISQLENRLGFMNDKLDELNRER
ncbi:MAG: LapA family protein [Bacteroidia bacterium]